MTLCRLPPLLAWDQLPRFAVVVAVEEAEFQEVDGVVVVVAVAVVVEVEAEVVVVVVDVDEGVAAGVELGPILPVP